MSKLDDILATIGVEGIDDKHVVGRDGAKQHIKGLILELIGEDEQETLSDKTQSPYKFNSNKRRRNILRRELRQKVNEQ